MFEQLEFSCKEYNFQTQALHWRGISQKMIEFQKQTDDFGFKDILRFRLQA